MAVLNYIVAAILASISLGASISGTAGAGNTLVANLDPSRGAASSWQWTRDSGTGPVNIGGATSSSYVQDIAADTGTTIGVTINGAYSASVAVPITLGASANITSGIAPLHVFFNALPFSDASTFNNRKGVLFYWNFGDTSSTGQAAWAPAGGRTALPASKNTRWAPEAGHVYETPGTYTPTLLAILPNGLIQTWTTTVTIYDQADSVNGFPAAQTWYLSNSGDFTGVPSGANKITTGYIDDAALISAIAANSTGNMRILYKRGDTYTSRLDGSATNGALVWFNATRSKVRIDAWGAGSSPILAPTPTIGFSIFMFGKDATTGGTQGSDFAVNNLNIQGPSANLTAKIVQNFSSGRVHYDLVTGAILETKGFVTVANCTATNMAFPLSLTGTGNAVVNNSFTQMPGVGTSGIVGTFGSSMSNFTYAGNAVDRSLTGEHGLRIQGTYHADIYSNWFIRCNAAKYHMAFRDFTGVGLTAVTVQSAVWSGGIVTVQTATPHGIPIATFNPTAATVTMAGNTPAALNGTFIATPIDATHLSFPLASDPGATTVFGTAKGTVFVPSQRVSISNNWIDSSQNGSSFPAGQLQIAPQNTSSYGQFLYFMADHNYFGPMPGGGISDMIVNCSHSVFRSNYHFTSGNNSVVNIQNGVAGTLPVTPGSYNNLFQRNSVYMSAATKLSYMGGASQATGIQILDTVIYAPNSTGASGAAGTSAVLVVNMPVTTASPGMPANTQINGTGAPLSPTDGNSYAPQIKTVSPWTNAAPVVPADMVATAYAFTGSTKHALAGASLDLAEI